MKMPGFTLGVVLTLGGLSEEAFAQLTEATTTAPRGGWLMEVDVFSVAVDRHTPANDEYHHRSTTIGSGLLSTGLSERMDVQVGMDIWREEKTTGGGSSLTHSDHGDGWLRAKWNFSGDESVGPAWAMLPYVKMPLANDDIGNGAWEPGAVLIFGCPLGELTQCNANVGVDWLDDGAGGRDVPLYGSVSVTRSVTGRWAIYGEFSGWIDSGDPDIRTGEIGLGLICTLRETVWLDAALYLGLNKRAPDYTPVLRFGWQF